MLKLSIATAGKGALPSAFVVFRDFEKHIPIIAELGFDGIELALKNASEIKTDKFDQLLAKSGLSVSCISTGQVFADSGFMFTDNDKHKRTSLLLIFQDLIDLAASYGKLVNIGRVRGNLGENKLVALGRFEEMIIQLCDYANTRGVTLVLEPVNRYEIDFINTVQQGDELLTKLNIPNLKLMPDVFHMNIEDKTIEVELCKYINSVGYIHLADSNRLAPGQGHINFENIFTKLKETNYSGWCSVEILPYPKPYIAAKQAADFLKPLINRYNEMSEE
jgi:sugar phosphate isomerase/epimerase